MHDHQPVPPAIDGLRPVRYLGSGGFGEVLRELRLARQFGTAGEPSEVFVAL